MSRLSVRNDGGCVVTVRGLLLLFIAPFTFNQLISTILSLSCPVTLFCDFIKQKRRRRRRMPSGINLPIMKKTSCNEEFCSENNRMLTWEFCTQISFCTWTNQQQLISLWNKICLNSGGLGVSLSFHSKKVDDLYFLDICRYITIQLFFPPKDVMRKLIHANCY